MKNIFKVYITVIAFASIVFLGCGTRNTASEVHNNPPPETSLQQTKSSENGLNETKNDVETEANKVYLDQVIPLGMKEITEVIEEYQEIVSLNKSGQISNKETGIMIWKLSTKLEDIAIKLGEIKINYKLNTNQLKDLDYFEAISMNLQKKMNEIHTVLGTWEIERVWEVRGQIQYIIDDYWNYRNSVEKELTQGPNAPLRPQHNK